MTHPKPPNFPLSERKGFLEMPASRRKDWSGRRDLNSGPPAPSWLESGHKSWHT